MASERNDTVFAFTFMLRTTKIIYFRIILSLINTMMTESYDSFSGHLNTVLFK